MGKRGHLGQIRKKEHTEILGTHHGDNPDRIKTSSWEHEDEIEVCVGEFNFQNIEKKKLKKDISEKSFLEISILNYL